MAQPADRASDPHRRFEGRPLDRAWIPDRVLLVTDNEAVDRAVRKLLGADADEVEPGPGLSLDICGSAQDAIRFLTSNGFSAMDIVLIDGDADGGTLAQEFVALKAGNSLPPIVVLSASADNDLDLTAIRMGAADVVCLGRATAEGLYRAMGHARQLADMKGALESMTLSDPGTGLASRALFLDFLTRTEARAARTGELFAVLFVAFDGPAILRAKAAGRLDAVMAEVGGEITGMLRASDLVARFDSDKLAVLIDSMKRLDSIQIVAEKISALPRNMVLLPGDRSARGFSLHVGVALYPTHGEGGEQMLGHAAEAMYRAWEAQRPEAAFY